MGYTAAMSWRYRSGEISELASLDLNACDGCGRCTAVCPVAEAMDLAPTAFVGLAKAGQGERLLRSSGPWICTDCRACTEACPQGVRVHGLYQWVRSELTAEGVFEEVPVDVEMVTAWFETFKATALRGGRAGHWWTFLRYRLASLDLFTNLALGWSWLLEGRLRLRPHLPSFALRKISRRLARRRKEREEAAEQEHEAAEQEHEAAEQEHEAAEQEHEAVEEERP